MIAIIPKRTYLLLTIGLVALLVYQLLSLDGLYEKEKGYLRNDIRNSFLLADYSETTARLRSLKTEGEHDHIQNSSMFAQEGHIVQEVKINFEQVDKPNVVFQATTPYPVDLKEIEDYESFNTLYFLGIHTGIDHLKPVHFRDVDSLLRLGFKNNHIDLPYRLSLVRIEISDYLVQARMQNPLLHFDENAPIISEYISSTGDQDIVAFHPQKMVRKSPLWVSVDANAYLYAYDMSGQYGYLLEIGNLSMLVFHRIGNMILFSIITLLLLLFLVIRLIKNSKKISELKEREKAFMQNMTHELKTPIAVSLAAVEALSDEEYPLTENKRSAYYNIIRGKLDELDSRISQILIVSNPRKRKHMQCPAISLAETLAPVLEDAKLRLTNSSMLDADVPVGIHVAMLPEDLMRVMANLLDNAIKYSPISPKIKIVACEIADQVVITVEDKGIGIPKRELSHIFDRFYRVNRSDVQSVRGTGLGLSDVKETLDIYGIEINVESIVGKGTCFKITINKEQQ
jgi:signal transduction histidine kinase